MAVDIQVFTFRRSLIPLTCNAVGTQQRLSTQTPGTLGTLRHFAEFQIPRLKTAVIITTPFVSDYSFFNTNSP